MRPLRRRFVALSDRFASLYIELDDIRAELGDYIYSLEYDADEAEKVEKRLEVIKNLKRKYGGTLAEVDSYLKKIKNELDENNAGRETAQKLMREKEKLLRRLYELSLKVSAIRKTAAKKVEEDIRILASSA